ncbi:thioesterase family protein [hydrocarbon metagenome]|uniref:Acyl-coenzyme A thioesterase THEM4 n=1 Tax=hydrocarbon metagenome TaxID=938273 RepID=A0A0W8FX22_9ZZZZ
MKHLSFQDYYPDDVAHCYGCGKLNEKGHQIKTYWEGEETITKYSPKEYHTAIPGYVYGGLLASLIDCHGTGSAAAAMYKHEGREMDTEPPLRFVTASLKVNYLRPTPLGPELVLRGKIREVKGKKVIVDIDLYAEDQLCVQGEVIAVKMPENLVK